MKQILKVINGVSSAILHAKHAIVKQWQAA